ncbi:MAG: prephenate/arogenate dehydrogenase family protein [Kordiimonadaceae bacterium]|jgi:cyclohexadieny/prephenate dehydrogenase|nr:prephenate/arogenate dehydrogenase family protein [Kordiimonadaceae bacterium]MBT6037250.1 prephenate/arogenate dehydrogenase family protein [Kordiimonadaceae bacterium]MBT6330550.1 prephenate/arogenate dehydrogenase family protein [Kordiimonadaceae bacterium]MBT7581667.1 prephenate/arogenate dehydrogenase family protein [Kordiimonadaceae bacterium]
MPLYEKISIIGLGLIGSSLARAIKENNIAGALIGFDENPDHNKVVNDLALVDLIAADLVSAVKDADLVILATPVGAYSSIAEIIGDHLKAGATLSDVGSIKAAVFDMINPHISSDVHLIPAHPVAGTEQSGPKAGFSSLFHDRWAILTPPEGADQGTIDKLSKFWQAVGSNVEIMEPKHHDKVLAITSHVPHLIAYNIVGTARDLEEVTKSEVIKFSAGGFRDFTRIAASNPTMWRDVFLNNKEAVLEMLGRFSEDLTALQRAIRWEDGDALYDIFEKTRRIRQQIIDAGQEEDVADFGRHQDE